MYQIIVGIILISSAFMIIFSPRWPLNWSSSKRLLSGAVNLSAGTWLAAAAAFPQIGSLAAAVLGLLLSVLVVSICLVREKIRIKD